MSFYPFKTNEIETVESNVNNLKVIERKKSLKKKFSFKSLKPKNSYSVSSFFNSSNDNNENNAHSKKSKKDQRQRKLSVKSFDYEKFVKKKKKGRKRMSMFEALNFPLFTHENNHSESRGKIIILCVFKKLCF